MPVKRGRGQSTGSPRQMRTQSLGAPNLTPEKYLRFVKSETTNERVSADYDFPEGLTGTQSQITLKQETITEARLTIISKILSTSSDPLAGQKLDEWGVLDIFESLVADGTVIDTGTNVLASSVDPIGDGTSIKISAKYPSTYIIGLVSLTAKGSGYTSAPTVVFTGGGGTGAAGTAIIAGGKVQRVDVTSNGSGYTSAPAVSFTGGGGSGAAGSAIIAVGKKVGQDYEQKYGVALPFVEYLIPATYTAGTIEAEIRTHTFQHSIAKTVDYSKIQTLLSTYVKVYPSTDDIRLPRVLRGIDVVWETPASDGDSSETGTSASTGTNLYVQLDLQNSNQGSAGVLADIIPDIDEIDGDDMPHKDYYFFVLNDATEAEMVAALTTLIGEEVLPWPRWRPKPRTFILRGQKIAVSAHASGKISFHSSPGGGSALAEGHGEGGSKDNGPSVRDKVLPPCINDDIDFSDDSANSAYCEAFAEAEITDAGGAAGAHGGPVTKSGTAFGSVSPDFVPATLGDTDIPTEGIRLRKFNVDIAFYGLSIVRARTFDFANLAV